MAALRAQGVGDLFGPGTRTADLIDYIKRWFASDSSRRVSTRDDGRSAGAPVTAATAGRRGARARGDASPGRWTRQDRAPAPAGKLTARERIERLCDPGTFFVEIGLLVAHDRYEGQAPAAGVVTGLGVVSGRDVVIVANDATVKAGSWWPETIPKILRAQEIAMRCRIPILYLSTRPG
jgi:acetyl-CoA carboxylase carboxyltransferase component